jgi:hypothetical protein
MKPSIINFLTIHKISFNHTPINLKEQEEYLLNQFKIMMTSKS